MVENQKRNINRLLIVVLAAICCLVIWGLVSKIMKLNPKEVPTVSSKNATSTEKIDSHQSPNAILTGINIGVSASLYGDVTTQEAQLGRQYDIVKIPFTSWQNVLDWAHATGPLTNSPEYKLSSEGRIVHISLKLSENWNSLAFNLHNPGSGRRNEVDLLAKHLQAYLPGPFFISINELPEINRNDNAGYSPQDYSDVVCAFHQIFKADGASKARFVFVTGPDQYGNNTDTGARFYPGDQCVDWIGVQAFNSMSGDVSDNWRSLVDILKSGNPSSMLWYDWATKDWTGDGVSFNNPTRFGVVTNLNGKQETKQAKGKKPLMLTAWASREDKGDSSHKAQWLVQARGDIASRLQAVKALEYYDVNTYQDKSAVCYGSDWTVNSTLQVIRGTIGCSKFDSRQFVHSYDGATFQAWKALGLTSYFNVSKGLAEGNVTSPAAQKRFQLFLAQK